MPLRSIQAGIEKDPGSPRVSRLRAIYLLDADYNLVLGIIWGRRMMWKAREHNMFMTAQQAQLGRLAIGAVLNKVLTFDLFRQTKKMERAAADATGCFDRTIPPESQLSCRRWGVPKKTATRITTVLNNTIYRIRTGHEISARTYQSDELRRILRVGQGSCAAPGILMAVLDPIL